MDGSLLNKRILTTYTDPQTTLSEYLLILDNLRDRVDSVDLEKATVRALIAVNGPDKLAREFI